MHAIQSKILRLALVIMMTTVITFFYCLQNNLLRCENKQFLKRIIV